MHEALRALVRLVAPRRAHIDLEDQTDLGFGGYGLTIVEYLRLLDRIEGDYGVRLPEGIWPHSVAEIAEIVADLGGGSAVAARLRALCMRYECSRQE